MPERPAFLGPVVLGPSANLTADYNPRPSAEAQQRLTERRTILALERYVRLLHGEPVGERGENPETAWRALEAALAYAHEEEKP